MWDPYAEFESATLPNGLTVHAAFWPGRPWEAVGFLIHSGAELDPVGLEGTAHFVEHLVSANAGVSEEELTDFFEDLGGIVNRGSTGYFGTMYKFFVPAKKSVLERGFSMFGRMLISARLEKAVERERQVIAGEFRQRYPIKLKLDLETRENKVLYPGFWLERFVSPFGNLNAIGQITQSDLQSYYDTHYTSANMSIVCVGGLQLYEMVRILSETPFAMRKEGKRTPLPAPVVDFPPLQETRHLVEMSQHMISRVDAGEYRSVARLPGNITERTVRIFAQMLDEVLTLEVREKRAWVYSFHPSNCDFQRFHEFSVECGGLAPSTMPEIEAVVEDCIASMGDREDLFRKIRRRVSAKYSMLDPNGQGVRDDSLNDLVNCQRIVPLAELRRKTEEVTMGDIHALLKWLRLEQRWTRIIKP